MTDIALAPSTQIKVTVPRRLASLIQKKAADLGLSLSGYIRHLMIDDARPLSEYLDSNDVPTWQVSKKMAKALDKTARQALREYKQGKTKELRFL